MFDLAKAAKYPLSDIALIEREEIKIVSVSK